MITLGDSEAHNDNLKKVVQFRWWGTPTKSSPLQQVKLEIDWITN